MNFYPRGLSAWLLLCFVGMPLSFAGNLFQHDRIQFQTFGLEDGLSQSTVQEIFQDSTGHMWFGTQNGLNRFDGYSFVSYTHEPFDSSSISGNFINHIYEQSNGTLWVVDGPVLHRLDRNTESFIRYTTAPDGKTTVPLNARNMIEDNQRRLWVSAPNGLFIYDEKTDHFTLKMGPDGKPIRNCHALVKDRRGNIWVGSFGGLYFVDLENDTVKVFRHDPSNPNSLSSDVVMGSPGTLDFKPLLIDEMGMLWIGTANGLNRYDPFSDTFTRYTQLNAFGRGMRGRTVVHVYEDSWGYIWYITREGWLNRLDRNADRIAAFGEGDDMKSGFRGSSITDLIEDRTGRLWVSTNGGGLNVMEPGSRMWRNIQMRRGRDRLPSNYIQTSYIDRSGNLWFGTFDQGVTKISPDKHRFRSYLNDPEALNLNSNVVWSINEDRENLLWVGTRTGVLVYDLYFDEVVKQYKYQEDGEGIATNEARAIHFEGDYAYIGCFNLNNQTQGTPGLSIINLKTDEIENDYSIGRVISIKPYKGKLVIGTFGNGMIMYDPEIREWNNYLPNNKDPDAIANGFVRAFAEDPDGSLWVVTLGGLEHFDPETQKFSHYRHDISNPKSISSDNILSIHMDEMDRLWIGTSGGGLNLYNREDQTFTHYTVRDGLPNNVIYSIQSDDQGDLWLGTNLGLARFSPTTLDVRSFDTQDGLQSNEYNVGGSFKSPTGQLLFGGINGFDAFFTHELREDRRPVPVVLSAKNLNGQVLNTALEPPRKITLQPDTRDVMFSFSALNFTSARGTRYAYRLQGFDWEWRITSSQRSVSYTNLPKGTYTFELRATNKDDVWNQQPLRLPIEARPYFYETHVFKGLFVVAALMVFFSIMAWQRGRILRRQQETLREIDLARKSEELEYARDLQIGLLPKKSIEDTTVEVTGRMVTATEVGGDYYDFFEIDERRLCIAFGDATGHGVAAGLVVGMVKMAATMWALEPQKPIDKVIEHINRGLQRSLPKRDMGMGFGLALLDRHTGEMEIAVSGMPFPYLFSRSEGTLKPIELRGLPLGFLRKVTVPSQKVSLEPGDMVVLLSDGLGERFDKNDNLWGEEALAESLQDICRSSKDPDEIADRLLAACDRFAGERGNDDDMTIVVMHFKTPQSAPQERVAVKLVSST